MSDSKLAVLIGSSLMLLPAASFCATLGSMTIDSHSGEPLKAVIAIEAAADEIGKLHAQIAPADMFRQANVERNPLLDNVQVGIDHDSQGHPVIRLTSSQPLSISSFDVLVELSGPEGRMVREYPVELLQPGDNGRIIGPAEVALPADAAPVASARPTNREIAVKHGDTLTAIAQQFRPQGVTLDQMLKALYDANPGAFMGHNMNRLAAGRILRIPDAGTLSAIDPQEAVRMVRRHEAAWQIYRQALVGAAPIIRHHAPGGRTSAGKIGSAVADVAPATSRDVLRLSRGDTGKGAAKHDALGKEARLNALHEELTSRQKSLDEANSRIHDLEKTVGEMKALLAVRDRQLAQMQEQSGKQPAAAPQSQHPSAARQKKAAHPVAAGQQPGHKAAILWAILGLLVASLGGLGVWLWRRRARTMSTDEMGQDDTFRQTLELARAQEPEADAQVELAATDPVDHARQLMADGRYDEAEEVLTEVLNKEPQRSDVLMLLLEILSVRANPDGFFALARQYQASNPGRKGPLWPDIAEMGRIVDPENPLYRDDAPAVVPVEPVIETPVSEPVMAAEAPISLDEIPSFTAAGAETAAEPAPEATPEGGVDLDFSFDPTAVAAAGEENEAEAPANLPPMDFSGIDLDLDAGAGAAEVETAAEPDAGQMPNPEAATKLDLARAYLEMGDTLGARQVLEEVMREGSTDQINEARTLVAQIA